MGSLRRESTAAIPFFPLRSVNMSGSVFMLVMVAATLHVLWNTLVRTCRNKAAFALLTSLTALLMLLPTVFFMRAEVSGLPGVAAWGWAALSGLFQASYTMLLFRAYAEGDLSMVYPLSRGIAPLFTLVLGGILLNDTISLAQGAAVVVISAGVFAVGISTHLIRRLFRTAILPALAAGLMIAGYHLVDRQAMLMHNAPPPVTYLLMLHIFLAVFVSAWVVVACGEGISSLVNEWRHNCWGVLIVGLCTPLSYGLIVAALRSGNVTQVVAVRNIGIVFSALVGWGILKEKVSPARLGGSLLIALGVAALALLAGSV